MAFRAELNAGPESKTSPASQHGDTLSFPPSFQRGDTLRFPSSPEIGPSLVPNSGMRASAHEHEGERLSGVLSTNSTPDRTSISEQLGESEPKIGDVIADRYVLEAAIARGGMGVVWRAYDREVGQQVAVKLVAPRLLVAEDAAARLCAEAKLLMLIDSPHVARILDAGTMLDGGPYMVTELLQGVTLQQLLEAHSSIPVCEAVGWICQAASGLADVHHVGLVHDDLKPSNLFLAEVSREQASIKLLDFGVARILSEPHASSTRGDVFGNPCYMAPERIAGSWYADHRADIWSLGVVLYELTTGQRPFDGDTLHDVCTAVMAATPRPIRELRPEVSPELEEAVRRCLQPRPEDRYENARLLLLDLKHALASLLVATSTPDHSEVQPDSALVGVAPVAPVAQSDHSALVDVAPVAPSDHSVEPRPEGSLASVRAAKLRSIVQAPSFQHPRPAQQHTAPVAMREDVTHDEAPPRQRRRGPAVIAYTIAITFVSLVGIIAAARTLRLGQAPVEAPEQPALNQRQSMVAQPPKETTLGSEPQEEREATDETTTSPQVNTRTIAVPESPAKDEAPAAQPGESTTIALPTRSAEASSVAPTKEVQATVPTAAPKAKPSGGWRPHANSRAWWIDTSPPRGIPVNEVHINAQGELTDAKGKLLPKADQ